MDFTKINEKFKKSYGFETTLRIDEVKLLESPCGGCSDVLKESKLTHLACGHIFELTKEQLNDHYYPSYYCPNCGTYCSNLKMSKDMEKKLKKKYPDARLPRLALNYTEKTILVENTENGIRINLVVTKSEINKDNEYVVNSEITSYLDFVLGKQTTGKKVMKKKEDKDIDPFEACGITTQNLRHLDVVYDGATDIGDFISKSSTCQKLDFFNIASRMKEKMSLDSLFILTIIAISTYPQLELLIKMRYYSLLGDIIKVLGRAYNRQMLAEEMQTFEKLFDIEATKGKDALRLPAYIGSYLVDRNADISEYLLWSDIYQITNISKEKFAELIVSPDFCTVSLMGWTCELPNILKYDGYSNILKVCKYAIRQNNKNNYYNVFDTFRDYLDMCSLCGIKHEMYPADIYKLHNELSVMKRDMEAKIENEQLKTLAGQLNEVINKKKEGEKEPEYVIVFPSNVNDFSQEASQQHNCVGWYYHNVLRGDCIIFFVRKASSPDESFITAEYNLRRRTISQFYYARNKAVTDKKLIELGHSVGKKIQAGIASKSITPIK